MEAGCPARTGAAKTRGLEGALEPAWRAAVGNVASEPRVWHDRVFVETASGNMRRLHVLGLGDGRVVAEPLELLSSQPMDFGVWDERILVQEGHGTLRMYELRRGKFVLVWKAQAKQDFYSPILFKDAVVVLDGETVVALDAQSGTKRWANTGSFRGGLAIAGPDVYVLETDNAGNLDLVMMELEGGRVRGKHFSGNQDGRSAPPMGLVADISVHPLNVFIYNHSPLKSDGNNTWRTSWFLRAGRGVDPESRILAHRQLPVAAGIKWIVTDTDKGRIQLRISNNAKKDRFSTLGYTLAVKSKDPAFPTVPMSVAGETAYVGTRCLDWERRQVTWMAAKKPRFRPVPAFGSLLVVQDDEALTCLRERGETTAGALFLGPAHAVGGADAQPIARMTGVVVFENGSTHEGDYEIDAAGETVHTYVKKRKKETKKAHPINTVSLVLDAEDRVLYTSSLQSISRKVTRWQHWARDDDYYKFAKAAFKTADPDLMRNMIWEAARRGVSDKKLKHPRKQLAALIKRPRKQQEKRKKKLLEEIEAVQKEDSARKVRVLESALDDPRWAIQQTFARRILRIDPAHARATALVAERLPSFVPKPQPFHPLEWIDFVDELQHTKASKIEAPKGESKDLTVLQREYGMALKTWREDLVALRSENLLILTPLSKPGRIAGCLAMGSTVCDALEEVFGSGKNVRKDPWPLILRLYETQQEFIDVALKPGASSFDRKQMEWTGGHYDPNAGISRIFLPERPDAWRRVMAVYAHELAHHWIAERCPLFKPSELRRMSGIPGYWIVEGMAEFIEEFQWDLEGRSWNTENPAAHSMDVVANAPANTLHPWKTVYNLTQMLFGRLKRFDAKRKVSLRWRMGANYKISDSGMFYNQAAATCHYLYHASPELRAKLLEYVRAYYTGTVPRKKETIQEIIGMSPEELGKRVIAHARKMNGLK